jgi:MerR family transcriptional regulator/heat shock protein HspR
MHPQTLRLYERAGLVKPARRGSNRLYSDWDIERLRQIQRFTQDMGVNLAGVEIILNLLEQISQMQTELEQSRQQRLPVPTMEDRRPY